jgi:hypothetical protein
MFSALRKRLHMTPGTVIATLALVFAMTGGAYAAGKYVITSTKQISPKVLKSLQGKAGKSGANGAPGATGPAGPQGPAGPSGAAGPKGENGAAGTAGAKGEPGAKGTNGTSVTNTALAKGSTACPEGGAEFKVGTGAATTACNGQTGFTETLPSGKTETGTWDISLSSTSFAAPGAETSLSFPIPLASGSEAGYVFTEAQTANKEFGSSGCTGSVETPTAPKGTLCVYTASEEHEHAQNSPGTLTPEGGFGFGKSGAVINGAILNPPEGETAQLTAQGTWAVTAP